MRAILGRPPRLVGVVVHGDERGRTLGFPTANIEAHTGMIFPGRGVYAARARLRGRWYRAAVNVGHNPTFLHPGDETAFVRIEAFLLDFAGEAYDDDMVVDFLAKLRDEAEVPGPRGPRGPHARRHRAHRRAARPGLPRARPVSDAGPAPRPCAAGGLLVCALPSRVVPYPTTVSRFRAANPVLGFRIIPQGR